MTTNSLHTYIQSLEKELSAGDTTEHTHRPALKALLEALNPDIIATNEPQHITAVGAPDFRIIKKKLAIGYVECKDIGKNLDESLETDQLKRYLHSFHNLLLTDYLEFRWYVGGKLRLRKILGTVVKDKIKQDKDSLQEVADGLISFLNHEPEPISSPKELAGHMARLAHMIREIIIKSLNKELVSGSLHAQWQAFRENLIPELSIEQFADMYAQTIAYGLFAARCETDNDKDFTRQQAAYLIPKTNPFLRKLFNYIAGPELDESITWAVDDLSQILAWADMEAVLKDFGKSTGKADPVVHFYETFLKEYDPKTREMRGVYYTPLPVVSYIVRSIDHILKTSFDKPQGLADPSVLVLDPAVGTATFLYMVMQEIHEAIIKQGQTGTWDNYVTEKLLPRLFGFELLMAPFAIAHLKLGRLLKETGYHFQTDQRLGIYLTNTLEEAVKHSDTMFAQWISEEANAAADIKKTKPIMVVLGNPPYSGTSANASDVERMVERGGTYLKRVFNDPRRWIEQKASKPMLVKEPNFIGKLLVDYYEVDGKLLGEKNPKWLQDDYVKFIRFGQWRIKETGEGILGFITNHSYLDNPTFRGMRQSLMKTFSDIYILNLHGNAKKKELTPDGGKDENVFDIQQGVTIGLFVKELDRTGSAKLHYAELWGLREDKYQTLLETNVKNTGWTDLNPGGPFYLFVPRNEAQSDEYEKGWKITNIFPVNSVGIVTSRDDFVLDFDEVNLKNRIEEFRETNLKDDEIRDKYELHDNQGWNVADARKDLRIDNDYQKAFTKCLYRPFDIRSLFYHQAVIERSRLEVMQHMLSGANLGFISVRQVAEGVFNHVFVSNSIVESRISLSNKGIGFLFPLYLYPIKERVHINDRTGMQDGTQQLMVTQETRLVNLNPTFVTALSEKLGLKFIEDGNGDLESTFRPEEIFNYAYAIFHSPTYRTRYAEFLKIDFPRLPLTSDKVLFKALAEKGAVLVSLHLMESALLSPPITKYEVKGEHMVDKVNYDEKTHRVSINKTQYFEGVPPEVWNFNIGGYQVCEKWLKDRKGRKLTIDEIDHYQKIVVALKETIRLMTEIDEIIEAHGGWPGAFD
jgi:predicted helicase